MRSSASTYTRDPRVALGLAFSVAPWDIGAVMCDQVHAWSAHKACVALAAIASPDAPWDFRAVAYDRSHIRLRLSAMLAIDRTHVTWQHLSSL